MDSCVPGDYVNVCGVVSLLSGETGGGGSFAASSGYRRPFGSTHETGGRGGNVFNLCLRVNNLTRIFNRTGEEQGECGRSATQCLTTRRPDAHFNDKITEANLNEVNDIQSGGKYLFYVYISVLLNGKIPKLMDRNDHAS